MAKFKVSMDEIQNAAELLGQKLPMTPLLRNDFLSRKFSCDVYLKLENMQPVGSFKVRGATYKISKLTSQQRKRGVIASSAGNHAQGVAWGSREYGVDALIVMPRNAALTKIQATKSFGATVHLEGDNFEEAYQAAARIARKTGRIFIHAYEDLDVIAGQGTLGLEILRQLPDVDVVVGSIGGGGLMAGVGTVIKELEPRVRLVACQALGASAMVKSLKAGREIYLGPPRTFADGIAIGRASSKMRGLLRPLLDTLVTASEEEIARGVLMFLEKSKLVVEGSGAIAYAALEKMKAKIRGKKVVVIVCGGNIDVNVLGRIIDRGLVEAGRRIRINVVMPDRPGSLNFLTELIAREGANVLQTIHDRNEPAMSINDTEIGLTLETKGPDHSESVIQALRKAGLRMEIVDRFRG